jgi:8-oxo-dGTP pyrophosphatase MutT (NUDIX family)
MLKKVSAKGIIWNDEGRVLIVHKVGDNLYSSWEVPGGRLRDNELLRDGLKRELGEEVGIKELTIGDAVGADEWTPTKDGKKWHVVCAFFSCAVHDDTVVLSGEHDDFAWVLPRELDNYDIAPRMRQMILNSALFGEKA